MLLAEVKRSILSLLIILLASLTFLELFLKIYPVTFTPVIASSDFGRIGNSLNPQIDQLGFRNSAPPTDVCSVFLGDSQVFGNGVQSDQTFAVQLEAPGGMATYNMGIPGTSIVNQLLLLPSAIELHPDMIYLSFYAGNDLADLYIELMEDGVLTDRVVEQLGLVKGGDEPVVATSIKTAWVERDRHIHEMVDRHLRDRASENMPWQSSVASAVRRLRSPQLLHSVMSDVFGVSAKFREPKPFAFDVKAHHGIIAGTDTLFINDDQFIEIFQNELRTIALDLDKNEIKWALATTEKLLLQAKSKLTSSSMPLTVLLIPTQETVFADALGNREIDLPASYRKLVGNENAVLDRLSDFMATNDISHLDLRPTLKQLAKTGVQTHLFFDGHLSAKGHLGIAEAILEAMPPTGCNAEDASAAGPKSADFGDRS